MAFKKLENAPCLEMMNNPQVVALAFRAIFSAAFEISVSKQVRVLGKVVNQAGADREDLFVVIDIVPIDLCVSNLIEPIAIDAKTQLFGKYFVGRCKVGMYCIPGFEIYTARAEIIILAIPEIV
jgi:hypothetical protein